MILPPPAELLLQSLGVTDPSEIDLEAIAFDRGALVKYESLDGCEARIVGAGNKAIITVDNKSTIPRQRFSTAHELGHWHHHRGKSFICRPEDIGNPRRDPTDPERVADNYAADLLMPRYLFQPRANDLKKVSFEAVDALRKDFQTSITATAIRLVELGPEPSMLVCHGPQGRKWFNRPKFIPDQWFPKKELDSDSFAFDVLFGKELRGRRALMDADTWFDKWDANRYQLFEQTHRISDDEVLTILVFKDPAMLEDTYKGRY